MSVRVCAWSVPNHCHPALSFSEGYSWGKERPLDPQSEPQLADGDKTNRLPGQDAAECEQRRRRRAGAGRSGEEAIGGEMSQFYKTNTGMVCTCARGRVFEILLSQRAINQCHYAASFPICRELFFKALHPKCQTSTRSERHSERRRKEKKKRRSLARKILTFVSLTIQVWLTPRRSR